MPCASCARSRSTRACSSESPAQRRASTAARCCGGASIISMKIAAARAVRSLMALLTLVRDWTAVAGIPVVQRVLRPISELVVEEGSREAPVSLHGRFGNPQHLGRLRNVQAHDET